MAQYGVKVGRIRDGGWVDDTRGTTDRDEAIGVRDKSGARGNEEPDRAGRMEGQCVTREAEECGRDWSTAD